MRRGRKWHEVQGVLLLESRDIGGEHPVAVVDQGERILAHDDIPTHYPPTTLANHSLTSSVPPP